MLIVQKYGGSSLADAAGILRVAQRIVRTKNEGHDVVAVVSAKGDTTDELIELAREVTSTPHPREYDMLLTSGERISMALLAMAIHDLGNEGRSFTGSQAGLITDSQHGSAEIIDVTPVRVHETLADGAIPIVAGFQGFSRETRDITTLGRGGSDTTAVALAASMDADVCEIYTDVDGVFTADPRMVPHARPIPRISYTEMLTLAAAGAKVLHPRAVAFAMERNVRLRIRSSFSEQPGTAVDAEASSITSAGESMPAAGVAYDAESRLLSVVGAGIGDSPAAVEIFTASIRAIEAQAVVQRMSEARLSAEVDLRDASAAACAVHGAFGLDARDEAVVYGGSGR